MQLPETVDRERWRSAHDELLAAEKAHTRAADALAARRRRLPGVEVRVDEYEFDGPEGRVDLLGLFDGRAQLITYHFMYDDGAEPCTGCSMFTDNVGEIAHLHARDTSIALVSRGPIERLERHRRRMGWKLPWYSIAAGDFNSDLDVPEGGFGLNVLVRAGDRVLRTYFTAQRGVEALGSIWTFLDLTPLGRQESWEDTPPGRPQGEPYEWWRLHDEYTPA